MLCQKRAFLLPSNTMVFLEVFSMFVFGPLTLKNTAVLLRSVLIFSKKCKCLEFDKKSYISLGFKQFSIMSETNARNIDPKRRKWGKQNRQTLNSVFFEKKTIQRGAFSNLFAEVLLLVRLQRYGKGTSWKGFCRFTDGVKTIFLSSGFCFLFLQSSFFIVKCSQSLNFFLQLAFFQGWGVAPTPFA